jgi:hypothetical protein
MPSNLDLRWAGKIVFRALIYAAAATILVIFLPSEPHVFVYQGF